MTLQKKVEIIKLGRVKVYIRGIKKKEDKILTTKTFCGYGLTVAEATTKAWNNMIQFHKKNKEK